MLFRLMNVPGTFKRTMNWVFFDILDKNTIVYLDDILIIVDSYPMNFLADYREQSIFLGYTCTMGIFIFQ